MTNYSVNPQSFTENRRKQIEAMYEARKDEIKADLESLELSTAQLVEKYNVSDRHIRRFADRLGIDPIERTYARRRAGLEKKAPPKKAKPKDDPDKANASRLIGLW